MSKDYYRILGVLDDAEDIVIKAAYKALAQRYHPDKWSGDKSEATHRMSDINEAYAVLADPVKRKEYDSTRNKNSYQTEPEDDELSSSVDSDWKKVTEFFPDLIEIANSLGKTSKSLEFSYKLTLLELKEFNRRKELAERFEKHFLEKYFGDNKRIIDFVKKLIQSNAKGALKAVNEAIGLLGTNVDPDVIIDKISKDWELDQYDAKVNELRLAKNVILTNSIFKSMDLIQLLGGDVNGPKNNKYIVTMLNGHTGYLSKQELLEYAQTLAHQVIFKQTRPA
jgi:hypothetical protein